MNHTVYLAGPIAGLTYDGASDWREVARSNLAFFGIKALSPLRAKEYLRKHGVLGCNGYGENPLSTNRGIMDRDRFDATRCDVLLVNLLGASKVSIGTAMEMAWADQCRTPVVCIIEPDGSNVHEHAMLNETIGFRAATLDEGLDIVKAILG